MTVIGLGSNLIVRDGGVPGVVIRLGRGFGNVAVEDTRIRAGAAVPDVKVARAAQEAGIAGLSFMRGIPGGVGGALRMNGGAYGRETKDALIEARAVDRAGPHPRAAQRRHGLQPTGTAACLPTTSSRKLCTKASAAIPPSSPPRWTRSPSSREATQPIKSRTGGSTFKNPQGARRGS